MDMYKLINKITWYGSPGYLMEFIPRKIQLMGKYNSLLITGDMPQCETVEGHYFKITEEVAVTLLSNGEVGWTGADGALNEWVFLKQADSCGNMEANQ